jgi:acetyltransferase-like isoleucine patch superfamily enzyme
MAKETTKSIVSPDFFIRSNNTEDSPLTCIGDEAHLDIEPSVEIEAVSGSINGTNNRIVIEANACVANLRIFIDGSNNLLVIRSGSQLVDCHLSISGNRGYGNFAGSYNQILIDRKTTFKDAYIQIIGNKNLLEVARNVYAAQNSELFINGFGCTIRIGRRTSMTNAFLHAEEIETKIDIGEDNMIAPYVSISTGDKHAVFSIADLRRSNAARSVLTGRHVWLAMGAQIQKGAQIGDHCIVGKHTTVSSPIMSADNSCLATHAVIQGIPARVQKSGISWSRDMFFDLSNDVAQRYPDAAAQSWCHKGHIRVAEGARAMAHGEIGAATGISEGLDAYRQALTYKGDYLYVHSAMSVAYVRLAQLHIMREDLEGAADFLRASLEALSRALALNSRHEDSLRYRCLVKQALEQLGHLQCNDEDSEKSLLPWAIFYNNMMQLEAKVGQEMLAIRYARSAQHYLDQLSQYTTWSAEIISQVETIRKSVLDQLKQIEDGAVRI